ncbi:MAG: hypothetical protein GWP04_00155 [Gammaproteobacteria bacterium]|nr:hypothetical protein [Gammaproteobacteria bacterium]
MLAGLGATAIAGVTLTLRRDAWGLGYGRIVFVTLGLIDLQVVLGLLVWITKGGWDLSVFRAYVHPIGMLIAVAVAHMAAARAKRQSGYAGVRTAAAGLLTALAIIVLTIPHNAWL